MRNGLWLTITIVLAVLGFLAGYGISSKTGVEPGYFEAAETGGYGGGKEAEVTEGVSEEMQEYYQKLLEE